MKRSAFYCYFIIVILAFSIHGNAMFESDGSEIECGAGKAVDTGLLKT